MWLRGGSCASKVRPSSASAIMPDEGLTLFSSLSPGLGWTNRGTKGSVHNRRSADKDTKPCPGPASSATSSSASATKYSPHTAKGHAAYGHAACSNDVYTCATSLGYLTESKVLHRIIQQHTKLHQIWDTENNQPEPYPACDYNPRCTGGFRCRCRHRSHTI